MSKLFGGIPSIFGINVLESDSVPFIEIEYRYLWPVICGHVWVDAVRVETSVLLVGNHTAVMNAIAYDKLLKEHIINAFNVSHLVEPQ